MATMEVESSTSEKTSHNLPLDRVIEDIEQQLESLLKELATAESMNHAAPNEQMSAPSSGWQQALDGFRVKAVTIRRILDQFHNSDLSTRRYMRHHLDEEFGLLQEAYKALRQQFTEPMENQIGGSPWNGSLPQR